MSSFIGKFRSYLRKNETARGLFLVGLVILGAIAVWGGIRLALNTEYPILVVSSGSMCPPNNCVLPVGSLIVKYAFVTHGDANPLGANEGPNPASTLVGVYQSTIPVPYLGSAILEIRKFLYDDSTGQPKLQGILVIIALILALFLFEVAEPGKKKPSSNVPEETKTSLAPTNILA